MTDKPVPEPVKVEPKPRVSRPRGELLADMICGACAVGLGVMALAWFLG